jgi:hypothetical protein
MARIKSRLKRPKPATAFIPKRLATPKAEFRLCCMRARLDERTDTISRRGLAAISRASPPLAADVSLGTCSDEQEFCTCGALGARQIAELKCKQG